MLKYPNRINTKLDVILLLSITIIMMANVQVGQWSFKSDIATGLANDFSLSVFNNAMETL